MSGGFFPPDDYEWIPFIERKDGVEYVCETCLDYGGIYAKGTFDDEGLPYMQSCPDCCGPSDDF